VRFREAAEVGVVFFARLIKPFEGSHWRLRQMRGYGN
jgi:hypothetical protein